MKQTLNFKELTSTELKFIYGGISIENIIPLNTPRLKVLLAIKQCALLACCCASICWIGFTFGVALGIYVGIYAYRDDVSKSK